MADLNFRVSSGLKSIIGRELITDDFIAVFELVKNAYDAHAKEVRIIFEEDKIVIRDDGKGMSYDDLVNKWLFVAYSAKKEGIEDQDNASLIMSPDYRDKIQAKRQYAGAKGIGRFSCDKLGNHLKLITKKAISKAKIEQLKVNWDRFEEDATKDFIKIKVAHETLSSINYPNFEHGTILEITGLREGGWPREKRQQLKQSLEKLINPFSILDKSKTTKKEDFNIIIDSDSDKEADKNESYPRYRVNGPVTNFIFETLNLKTTQILTTIDEKGESISTELIDRDIPIYKIKEKNNTTLKNITYHLFHLNQAAKVNFKRLMGIEAVNFGHIFLFRNGFRVYPFGEIGEDTLGLDARKQQKVWERLGTRDLIGRIEITDKKDDFKETSSRDGGLIKNSNYIQLTEIFKEKCLKRLENYVVDVNWQFKSDKLQEDLSSLDNIDAKSRILNIVSRLANSKDIVLLYYNKDFLHIVQDKIEEQIPEVYKNLASIASKTNDSILLKEVERAEIKYNELRSLAEKTLQAEEEARSKAEEDLEIEKNKNVFLLATRHTLSDDAQGLIHNIKLSSTHINDEIETLITNVKKETIDKEDLLKKLAWIKIQADKVLKISKLITRANFKVNAAKQKVDIAKYIEQYISSYSEMYDKTTLKFKIVNHDASFWALASILELSIVFDNLISNSTKAHATEVLVEMKNLKKNQLQIIFSDNGDGVNRKYLNNIERIFELGVTETEGSGIGLFTVKELLNKCKGKIKFIGNDVRLKGASFQIDFGDVQNG